MQVKPPLTWRYMVGQLYWRLLWLLNDKFTVGVSGAVFDQDGRILVLRHRFWQSPAWGLPGGLVKRGETVEDAFRREIREETNYTLGEVRLLRVRSGFRMLMEVHFWAQIESGPQRLDRREILEARFCTPAEILGFLRPAHCEVVEMACAARDESAPAGD